MCSKDADFRWVQDQGIKQRFVFLFIRSKFWAKWGVLEQAGKGMREMYVYLHLSIYLSI